MSKRPNKPDEVNNNNKKIKFSDTDPPKPPVELINKIEPAIKKEHKVQALEIMKNINEKYEGVEINIRSLIKASRIIAMGFDNPFEAIAEQIVTA